MLKKETFHYLGQLQSVLYQIRQDDYSKRSITLENGTIGKHVRHVLEFYECLLNNSDADYICYEDRKRNILLEENVRFAEDYLMEMIDRLNTIETNKRILIKCKYGNDETLTETSLYRELIYNIEHTVHHLAIIRIAIKTELSYINLDTSFGYADSTLQFLKTKTNETTA
jgi:hypothetical protein